MIEAMVQEAQEIRFKAAIVEQNMLQAAKMVPEAQELLGPEFFQLEQDDDLAGYLRAISRKLAQLEAALRNAQFFENNLWPEAMVKLTK